MPNSEHILWFTATRTRAGAYMKLTGHQEYNAILNLKYASPLQEPNVHIMQDETFEF